MADTSLPQNGSIVKKQKRGTPRRRKPAPKIRKAIAKGRRNILDYLNREPSPATTLAAVLGEPVISAAFVGTLELTEKQIKALRRPVEDAEIEFRAAYKDGPPTIPYMAHNGYRDRLDAAFGLGGWGMVPVGMPKEKGDAIYTPYALVVGGVPRVYAWGEQQLHKMTYGDGLEGAQSNAIVRCGKALGIARELWDRKNVEAIQKRLLPAGQGNGSPRPQPAREAVHAPARADEPITEAQKIRLWTIVKKTGRPKLDVGAWLTARYGVTDSAKIKRKDYADIIEQIEAQGPLATGREPGEEG
jgi:hypothetical protein